MGKTTRTVLETPEGDYLMTIMTTIRSLEDAPDNSAKVPMPVVPESNVGLGEIQQTPEKLVLPDVQIKT